MVRTAAIIGGGSTAGGREILVNYGEDHFPLPGPFENRLVIIDAAVIIF